MCAGGKCTKIRSISDPKTNIMHKKNNNIADRVCIENNKKEIERKNRKQNKIIRIKISTLFICINIEPTITR